MLLKEQPDPVVAELSIFRPQLPHVANLVFDTCLFAALLSARNKINDSCSQQIVCAAVTLLCFNQGESEYCLQEQQKPRKAFSSPANLKVALEKAQLNVWSSIYQTFSQFQWKLLSPSQTFKYSRKPFSVLGIAHLAALRLQPAAGKRARTYASTIKSLFQILCSRQAELLTPLLTYPGLTPPGSIIKDDSGDTLLVLSIQHDGLLAKELNEPDNASLEPRRIETTRIKGVSPVVNRKSFNHADIYWDVNWESSIQGDKKHLGPFVSSFRLDRPPAVLIEIQDHLQNADIDFNKLADLIAAEPSLAIHLKESASQSSRSKLPIQDIKHSLMMHGYERANSLLIQQALLLRLNQNYFPLQDSFVQFTRLRCHLASSIIGLSNKSLVEDANCLACFANSGLFTVPTLKGVTDWLIQDKKPFDIRYLMDTNSQQALHDNAIKLAEAWKQSPHMVMALRNHLLLPEHMAKHKVAAKLAVTLGLSLILAREIYFAEKSRCQDAVKYRQQAMRKLGVTSQQLAEISLQASAYCHSHCVISD